MGFKRVLGVGVLLLGLGATGGVLYVRSVLKVDTPDYGMVGPMVWLEQNWTPAERQQFHHAPQGTRTFVMPYEWFVALEQPNVTIGDAGLFASQDFLDRFGFIPGRGEMIADQLPVGFAEGTPMVSPATGEAWTNPATGKTLTAIGLTCAGCHTGRFTYKGANVFVDGGPALIDLASFQTALGLALVLTHYDPLRFDRFAARVLGPGASEAAEAELRDQLARLLGGLKAINDADKRVESKNVAEGFGRLDALNRIGNQLFAVDMHRYENYAPTTAPVSYPQLWGTPWFDWVEYNGSIERPMTRNAGEALGVRALVNLTGPRPLFDSTLKLDEIHAIEQMIAGVPPMEVGGFGGLRPPAWPADILPPVDAARAKKGAALYGELCQSCHLPPTKSKAFWSDAYWTAPNAANQRYLKLPMIDIATVGTDEAQAADMASRRVVTPPELGFKNTEYGPALGEFVEKTTTHWFDTQQPAVPQATRDLYNGFRANGIRAPLQYRARPLDGVWSTAPFLHNGSVPTLDALLSPLAERPAAFQVGQREFDPVKVGYSDARISGGFELDTRIRGNSNAGHEFDDGPPRKGVIGRRLSKDERAALVEYMKTL